MPPPPRANLLMLLAGVARNDPGPNCVNPESEGYGHFPDHAVLSQLICLLDPFAHFSVRVLPDPKRCTHPAVGWRVT